MKKRRSSIVAVLTAVLVILALSACSAMIQVHASAQPIPLEFGYGLTSLTPVSSGIPVYTVGDTLWVLSNFNETAYVFLSPPKSSNDSLGTVTILLPIRNLENGVPVPLHEFTSLDREGIWSANIVLGNNNNHNNEQRLFIPVHFIKADSHRPSVALSEYSLQKEQLLLGFDISSTGAYDAEMCLAARQTQGTAIVQLPGPVGAGEVGIKKVGNTLVVSTNGSLNSPFTFWVELYHPFSFNVNGTTEFISRSLKAASSAPIIISSSGISNTTLNWETSQRVGRYEARVFFQGASGILVAQARILVPDGESWLSLDSSCQLKAVTSSAVSYLASLRGAPTTWPSALYLMYRAVGVEGASVMPLKLNVSKVTFVAKPWNVSTNDILVRISQPDANLQQYSLVNGSVYLIAKSYPLNLSYAISTSQPKGAGAGTNWLTREVQVPGPYEVQEAPMSVGKLMVHILNQEAPSAGVQVRVSGIRDNNNNSIVKTTDINAYATFFLPAGAYEVTASLAGQSKTSQVNVSEGNESVLNMQIPPASALPSDSVSSLENILVITGGIAVVMNLFVWVIRPRLSRWS